MTRQQDPTAPAAAVQGETSAAIPAVTSAEVPGATSGEVSTATSAEASAEARAATPAAVSAGTSAVIPVVASAEVPGATSAAPVAETAAVVPGEASAARPGVTPVEVPGSATAGTAAVIPPMPEAPPAVPAPEPRVRRERRVLRAALRWTAAAVVFVVVGAGTAYGITRMERTDVPGLATASDGRWDYPEIVMPPLPSGSPGPFMRDNKAGAHYADLRALVLPAPKGAKADADLRGTDGWLATKGFLAQYASADDREELGQKLIDNGLRHIAARGWTTPDGTRTRIYLLQFDTAAVVDELFSPGLVSYDSPVYALRGAQDPAYDDGFPEAARAEKVTLSAYDEAKPYGAEQLRQAYLSAGDTIALVVQSRKGTAKAVPFQQTVALQSQLLG